MKRGRKKVNYKWFATDFETDTTLKTSTFIWSWGFLPVEHPDEKHFCYGTSMETFFYHIFEVAKTCTPILFFHNLKFDGSFMLDFMIKHGWEFVKCKPKELGHMQYTTLISDSGRWYSVAMNFHGRIVKLQDSFNKLPFSVRNIAKSLDLPIKKGEIDYSAYRAYGAEDLDPKDKEYLYGDVYIMARALRDVFYKNGHTAMTIGSDCLAEYKRSIGREKWKAWYPPLSEEIDHFCRKAYRGGYVYAHRKGHIKKKGVSFDYNSMYPSVMHSSSGYLFPCGEPQYFTGEYVPNKRYPLYFQRFRCQFDVKKDKLPTVQLHNTAGFMPNKYVESSGEKPVEITLTNVDLELFMESYDVYNFEPLDGYMFAGKVGMFDDYINKWFQVKMESDDNPCMRQLAKLFLNNLYGKFATSSNGDYKTPYLKEDGTLAYHREKDKRDTIYVPVGAFTTAYSRKELFHAIYNNFDRFCYCDTDSVYCVGSEPLINIKVDKVKLGHWKDEGCWDEAIFHRPKTYMVYLSKEKKWKIKCAGMPENVKEQVTVENFVPGHVFQGKMMLKRVPGGMVLEPKTFVIQE